MSEDKKPSQLPAHIRMVQKLENPIMNLGGSSVDVKRVMRQVVMEFDKNPKLKECTHISLACAILQGVAWRLEFGLHCHIVPFKDKNRGMVAVFMPNYQGLAELAYRTGKVDWIKAECVYAEDEFDYIEGTENKIMHKRALSERGEIVAVYAVADKHRFRILDMKQIKKVQNASKGADSSDSPWKHWFDEMCEKTAVKRLCKRLPKSPELTDALTMDDKAEMGAPQTFGEDVIKEVDATVVEPADSPLAKGRHRARGSRTQSQAAQTNAEEDKAAKAEADKVQRGQLILDLTKQLKEDFGGNKDAIADFLRRETTFTAGKTLHKGQEELSDMSDKELDRMWSRINPDSDLTDKDTGRPTRELYDEAVQEAMGSDMSQFGDTPPPDPVDEA